MALDAGTFRMNDLDAGTALEAERDERLEAIAEQTREIRDLLRSLISMLLPKDEGSSEKFEDLIAALVAQQRNMLILLRQIQEKVELTVEQTAPPSAG
jgi:hypothetical protein